MSTPDSTREFCQYIDATRDQLCAELRRIAEQLRKNNTALREIIRDLDDRRDPAV